MNPYIIELYAKERQRELDREIRGVRFAEPNPHDQLRLAARLLYRIGGLAIQWGRWLQARYPAPIIKTSCRRSHC